jgi:hypothetical protein
MGLRQVLIQGVEKVAILSQSREPAFTQFNAIAGRGPNVDAISVTACPRRASAWARSKV